jgi:protein-S-isoprenylcysteine O-methyltransferase Ste14
MVDRALLRERVRRGQTGEDPARLLAIRFLVLAHLVLGIVEAARGGTAAMPQALRVAGLMVLAPSLAWTMWAVSVNRFFVPVIRVQNERGHAVVSDGPYAWLRHPGYAGMVSAMPASALALGSWWALVPALLVALLFVRRVAHEDRFLLGALPGYSDYAARVRSRLVPGLW